MSFLLGARERVGHLIGASWAPLTAAISKARQARMFHPQGIVCTGEVTPVVGGPFEALGQRLAGPVLARCSAALWKGQPRWFDVLGVALRFEDDQDLLFATIRSPVTMPFAPLATDTEDYLGNRYWAVSPFEVEGVGRMKFLLEPAAGPSRRDGAGGERDQRLRDEVAAGDAGWQLSTRPVFTRTWHPIAHVGLDQVVDIDQAALRFDPFRAGRGIVPSGLVHAIRPAAYAGSQRARPAHD